MATANLRGERAAVQRTMEALMGETRRSAQAVLPLSSPAKFSDVSGGVPQRRELPEHIADLVFQVPAERRLSDLVLSKDLKADVCEFLSEFSQSAVLHQNSLEPRHTLLLVGPPGNGKTSLAEVIATELSLPLLTVRYDAIVDSYLGETSSRLRKLIQYATANPCVLFFDEFEAVAKERSDAQETGEIKRVVSSLLLQIDRLPSHTIVVCATNHPELLDRAIWRRFQMQLEVGYPDRDQLMTWFDRFQSGVASGLGNLGIGASTFARAMQGRSMSDIEGFTLDVRRKLVLAQGTLTAREAVQAALQRLKKNRTRFGKEHDGDELSSGADTRGGQPG
jgi:SpoVK/Ycf46/Vps4 family AAA+-type ATPase